MHVCWRDAPTASVGSPVADRALDLALPGGVRRLPPRGRRRSAASACPRSTCGSHAEPGVPMGLPADIPAPLLQLEWCAPFTGVTRRALHALKYDGERRLAPLARRGGRAALGRAGVGGEVLVPVPASPDRVRERGYDQAALLAAEAGRRLRLPVLRALERTRATTAQFDLDRAARASNLGGAFRVVRRRAHGSPADGSCSSTTSSPPARPSPLARPRCWTPARAPSPRSRSPRALVGPPSDRWSDRRTDVPTLAESRR